MGKGGRRPTSTAIIAAYFSPVDQEKYAVLWIDVTIHYTSIQHTIIHLSK